MKKPINQNNEPDISWLKEDQKIKLTDFKTLLVMILSPLSCILVWLWLLFLTND